MMTLLNTEYFGFDAAVVDDLVSINALVDPQDFDLKSYKKTPFASIMIKSDILADEIKLYGVTRDRILEILDVCFNSHYFEQYNLYTDNEYETYTSKFADRKFHTMLYFFDVDQLNHDVKDSRSVVIAALPLKGMITPMPKSIHYRMYNGCLISCKPFKGEDGDFFSKLLYVLVEIRSFFSFQEFVRFDTDKYGMMLNYQFYASINSAATVDRYDTMIPYEYAKDLFEKPQKNIFQLSDVPRDITIKRDTLSVKI